MSPAHNTFLVTFCSRLPHVYQHHVTSLPIVEEFGIIETSTTLLGIKPKADLSQTLKLIVWDRRVPFPCFSVWVYDGSTFGIQMSPLLLSHADCAPTVPWSTGTLPLRERDKIDR